MTDGTDARRRAAETKRRRTREQIVQGALNLYGTHMKGDFTRDEIAQEAGVGVATVHNHFPSKYEVLRAAYERLLSPIVQPVVDAEWPQLRLDEPPSARPEALIALIGYVVSVVKVSDNHRALTIAMIRAYYEKALEKPDTVRLREERPPLSGPVAEGMWRLIQRIGKFTDYHTLSATEVASYHSHALLQAIFETPDGGVDAVVGRVLSQLVPVVSPGTTAQDVLRSLEQHADA